MRKDKEQFIGSIYGYTGRSYAGCVWDVSAISPMLSTMQGGGREPHIMEVEKLTFKVFNLGSENPEYVPRAEKEESVTLLARDYKGLSDSESNTVCEISKCKIKQATVDWIWQIDGQYYRIRIRKLTPKECWRLMDFNPGAFDKAQEQNSNTQLYKQAGNSIVVNCLVAILGQLFDGHEEDYKKVVIDNE